MDREAYRQCLSRIFSFLKGWVWLAACVCKEWRELAEPFLDNTNEMLAYKAIRKGDSNLLRWVLYKSPYKGDDDDYNLYGYICKQEKENLAYIVPGYDTIEGTKMALAQALDWNYLPLLQTLKGTRVVFAFRFVKTIVRKGNLEFLKCIGLPYRDNKREVLLFMACTSRWLEGYQYILQQMRKNHDDWEGYWIYIQFKYQFYVRRQIKRGKESDIRRFVYFHKSFIPLTNETRAAILNTGAALWCRKEKKLGGPRKKDLAK